MKFIFILVHFLFRKFKIFKIKTKKNVIIINFFLFIELLTANTLESNYFLFLHIFYNKLVLIYNN